MAKYIDDSELFYELVLSKGKGFLTKNAENMFILIANNTIRKKEKTYKNPDDKNDCIQHGLMHMLSNWQNFNEKRYNSALPYITEIFKRGIADGLKTLYNNRRGCNYDIKIYSIDAANEGRGLHII